MSWGPLQILLILLIVVLLFGTKKLRNLGSDLGTSIKSFKKSMKEGEGKTASSDTMQKMSDAGKEKYTTGEQQRRMDEDDTR